MAGTKDRRLDATGRRQQLEERTKTLFARHALGALRGPKYRGAAPVLALAEHLDVSRATVVADLHRELGEGSTPFDLVVRSALDHENGTEAQLRDQFLQALASFAPGRLDEALVDSVRRVLADVLADAFRDPDNRQRCAIGFLLHSAAACCDQSSDDDDVAAAETIVRLRTASYRQTGELHGAAIRLLLRASGRRPRAMVTVDDIVRAIECFFDGYLMRHLIDKQDYPVATSVEMMWEVAMGMTEPGVLGRDEANPVRDAVLAACLDVAEGLGRMPDLEEVDLPDGMDIPTAFAVVGAGRQLAWECLDLALGRLVELRTVFDGAPDSVPHALRTVLRVVNEVADRYRAVVKAGVDAPVWEELRSLVETLLSAGTELLVVGDPRQAASLLLDNAMLGTEDGKAAWVQMLSLVERRQHARPLTDA